MDFKLSKEQLERREEFYDLCRDLEKKKPSGFVGLESAYGTEEGWQYHLYCASEFAKREWLSLGWPKEHGGKGDMMDRVLFGEARGYYGIPGVDIFGVGMLAPTLIAAASDEIKKEWLPMIASGKSMGCELWSEPDAGSDLASLSTFARREGDEYVINGQKTWTSGAHRADWGFGVFKTDQEARMHHNLSFLLLDMHTPGITVRPIQYMDGGYLYNDVFFDEVRIPARNIVGQENEGWAIVNLLAGFERSSIDEIMLMVRHLEDLVNYCNETYRDGAPLSRDPVVRDRLAEIASDIEAARCLAYRVVDLQNRKEMSLMDASAVKVFASDLGERFASLATDILGPYGQVKYSRWSPLEGVWEKMYQECFVFSIAMGTNEIQKNIISWYGLGLPRMK
jgi:alkylation response protein AidB-like acyl-CoA dehydrogenase